MASAKEDAELTELAETCQKDALTFKQGGNIAMANADAAADAYTHAAIDQAYRAVGELPTI